MPTRNRHEESGWLARAGVLIALLAFIGAGAIEPVVHALPASGLAVPGTAADFELPRGDDPTHPEDGICVACQLLAGLAAAGEPLATPAPPYPQTEPRTETRLGPRRVLSANSLPRAPPA
jgi:hypothetical protein